MNLQDKVAVITGGASGLARRTVEHFVQDKGARVCIFDINDAAGADVVRALGGDRVLHRHIDVNDEQAVAAGVAACMDRFGRVDVCINSAASPGPMKILDAKGRASLCGTFRQTVLTNLVGTFNVMAHCVEQMAKNEPWNGEERGVVINIASIAAFDGQVGQVAYSASKAGVIGMNLPAARDLADIGVRVNTIAPGLFLSTPMAHSLGQKVIDSLTTMIEFPKRIGDPWEFAILCAHICENTYLNGENIRLDAAVRMRAR